MKKNDVNTMAIIYLFVMATMIGGSAIYGLTNMERFVVTDKTDNKIEYKSLRDGTVRVLNFTPPATCAPSNAYKNRTMYYDYINPGDTIRGMMALKNEMVPAAWQYDVPMVAPGRYKPTVRNVNNTPLDKWIEMQRRDSLVRVMRQKQKQKEK